MALDKPVGMQLPPENFVQVRADECLVEVFEKTVLDFAAEKWKSLG